MDKYLNSNKKNRNQNDNKKIPEEDTGSEEQYERIQNIGSVIVNNRKKKIYCLTIIGQIEGHTYLPSENKTTK